MDENTKPFRWGLIGAGDIVRKRVASALQDTSGSEIIAVSRKQEEQAAAFAESLGVPKSYSRWEDLVSDPDVDGVYIATPVFMHAPMTIRAAECGKHVLCEKPMALTVAECDAMLEACRKNNVKLGIAYYRHFYPVVSASGKLSHPAGWERLYMRTALLSNRLMCPPIIRGIGSLKKRNPEGDLCLISVATGLKC